MRFISFTSGSCGNCCCLESKDGMLLIDAGASMRKVRRLMNDVGLNINDLNAILVTHEHLDHIRFLGTYCKYLRPSVCAPRKLHGVLAAHTFTKDYISSCRNVLEPDVWNVVGGFEVKWFEVPHDAAQTVGYAIRGEGHIVVIMTDLQNVTPEAFALASQADTVIIESNYDLQMLKDGPYTPELKQRILDEGHLSNDACAEAIRRIWHPGLRNLFLCHLSGNNNTPQKAYACAAQALSSVGVEKGSVHLRTLERGAASPLIIL